ncbi:MAG: hypothetical protein AB8B53_11785 [Flavobacteriales bacterium]
MSENKDPKSLIQSMLKDKACLKQDIYQNTSAMFNVLKEVLVELIDETRDDFGDKDSRVRLEYNEKGDYEAQITFGGDVLHFYMHTNVFKFENTNSLWKTTYLEEDASRGYVGVINIYNFLADSIKYRRVNDTGYLIARIFVNRDDHFLVQGKRQLGFLYNDFTNASLDKKGLKEIVQSAMIYTLDFDLYTPPYQNIQEVSVKDIEAVSQHLSIKTGKRLGFKFQSDNDSVE